MPNHERVLQVVKEWVDKAEHDIRAAQYLLGLESAAPTDIVCFHAQQCAEKYLKSVLVLHQIPVPKTHDIEKVLNLVPEKDHFQLTTAEMRTLTAYAINTRYPAIEEISLEDARKVVALADSIRNAARKILPPEIGTPSK